MRMRRGSLHHTDISRVIEQFIPGMYVVCTYINGVADSIRGVVQSVDKKAQKVNVAWNGGAVKQHDPTELMPATMPVSQQPKKESETTKKVVMEDEKNVRLSKKNIHQTVANVMRGFIR